MRASPPARKVVSQSQPPPSSGALKAQVAEKEARVELLERLVAEKDTPRTGSSSTRAVYVEMARRLRA